jgi:hypothetical protein
MSGLTVPGVRRLRAAGVWLAVALSIALMVLVLVGAWRPDWILWLLDLAQ